MRRVGVGAVGVGRARGVRPDRANMPTSNSRRRRAITSCWSCGPTSASDRSRPAEWSSRAPTGPSRPAPSCSPRSRPSRRRAAATSSSWRGATRLPGSIPTRSPSSSGCTTRSASSIALHQYSGALPADQARQGPRLDAGRGRGRARPAAPATTMRCSSTPRTASPRPAGSRCRCWASPAASSAFARPTSAAAASSAMPAWSTCTTGEVVWFNVVQAGSQIAGIKFGDIRTDEGAAQMVDRLLDRMKPGRNVRRRERAQ